MTKTQPNRFTRIPGLGMGSLPFAIVAAIVILVTAALAGLAAGKIYASITGLGQPGSVVAGGLDRLMMIREFIDRAARDLTMVALTIIAAILYSRQPRGILRLGPPGRGVNDYTIAVLVSLLAAAVWFAVFLSLMPETTTADFRPYGELMSREASWLMLPVFCFLAPVAEELLFRGLLFSALRNSFLGIAGAALLTSAFWASLHVNRTGLAQVQIFLSGLLLSAFVVQSGSVRVPILCHILFNVAVSTIVIGFGWPA